MLRATRDTDAVSIELEINAPPERVFLALTDPAALSRWWTGAVEGSPTHWEIDAREGGAWRAVGEDASCGRWELGGEITLFNPFTALAYTWHETVERGDPPPAVTRVRYDLRTTPRGTLVTMTHSGFAGHPSLTDHGDGWAVLMSALQSWSERAA